MMCVPYDGSLVDMGLRAADGSVCHIFGLRQDIRECVWTFTQPLLRLACCRLLGYIGL
jgi:hypothetical protein